MQFIVFAKILALEVFPTPRGPQNRYAWASCPLFIEFLRVVAMLSCPTRPVKLFGLYFLADTINFSITHKDTKYLLNLRSFLLSNGEYRKRDIEDFIETDLFARGILCPFCKMRHQG